ncbi:MAG TPA: hypothetical protein PK079_16755 [Leptospiraceae bacterium]|nr:hypothetical protein [Leptospiraceae bacterium]HMW04208.1 hypothetical protein [Leptospiraceae bacterium]HMX32740.1 hypothetical protein [Leptospiraceae bacterium]HMY30201.1 hypothetical protein [Leptospiraceae bacterium]HMZ67307.1 hypothetical protein [Leptospiraceae bacterium]
MLSRLFIIVYVFVASVVFAQSPGSSSNTSRPQGAQKSEQGDSVSGAPAKGNYANGLSQNIVTLQKSINDKVDKLNKLQVQLSEVNKSLGSHVTIPEEEPNIKKEEGVIVVSARRIEFTFQGNNTSEVKIISSKRRINNDLHSVVRTLTFNPGDFNSIKVKVDQFDSKMKGVPFEESYNAMSPDVQLVALKAIDLVLFNTIYRYDNYLQKRTIDKQENTKSHINEL